MMHYTEYFSTYAPLCRVFANQVTYTCDTLAPQFRLKMWTPLVFLSHAHRNDWNEYCGLITMGFAKQDMRIKLSWIYQSFTIINIPNHCIHQCFACQNLESTNLPKVLPCQIFTLYGIQSSRISNWKLCFCPPKVST